MILALETSCDDTSVALVDLTGAILFHRSLSQISLHAPFGGVVPELASRTHALHLPRLVEEAFRESGREISELSAAALTIGPGLSGGLLAAIAYLKGLCFFSRIPLIPVHHVRAHLRVAVGSLDEIPPEALGLVVSGGHTHLYRLSRWPDLELLARTTDDAAGEAFDKGAKALGLPYPGGPEIERLASRHEGPVDRLVKSIQTPSSFDMSFSGLKTAFVSLVSREGKEPERQPFLAASCQEAIISHIIDRVGKALRHFHPPALLVGGGVAANGAFRKALEALCGETGVSLHVAPRPLCGDNAVMVALMGLEIFRSGQFSSFPYDEIGPRPRWDED